MRRALAGVALVLAAGPAFSGVAAQERVEVSTQSGRVAGVMQDVSVFKGIPYAASPVGPLRWAGPSRPAAWSAPRDTSDFGPICPQPARPDGVAPPAGPQSEDCLSLNIWAPRGARRSPVMVWVHGGAHLYGSGSRAAYDGTAFARDGVVLVTFNYRLGALGYFAHPSLTRAAGAKGPLGNYGLMDQMAALAWVRRNIAAFGGDPGNVTVFGESAGGSSILALLATPSAKGLFDKAIVESGGGRQRLATFAEEEANGVQLATRAGLPGPAATVDQLRALRPEQLFNLAGRTGVIGAFPDGRLLLEHPAAAVAAGRVLDVPLIIGWNSFEASLIRAFTSPPQAWLARLTPGQRSLYGGSERQMALESYTDTVMGAPARWIAARTARGAPSWLYHFSYVPTHLRSQAPGAAHGSEIAYVFDNVAQSPAATDEDRAMADLMHACWVAFARTGQPGCGGGEAWPAYQLDKDSLMEFGATSGVRRNFRKSWFDVHDRVADAATLRLP